MGRRIGAYAIDSVLIAIIAGVILVPFFFSQLDTAPAGSIECNQQQRRDGSTVSGSPFRFCYDTGNEVKYLRPSKERGINMAFYAVAGLEWLVFYVLMQGVSGASPGKLVLGLRVVKPDGTNAGIGRCAVRTLILPIDAGCCWLPGLISSFTSRGHRRIGDMAANTLVIGRDDQQALMLARSGVALPDRRTLAAAQYAETHRPATPTWEDRANQIHIPGVPDLPGDATIDPTGGSAAPGDPVWDAARGAYIWFDPDTGAWLQHDEATGRWGPITT